MSTTGTPSRTIASQRASPFRRPESPLGRSPTTVRPPPSQGSPLKRFTPSRSASDMRTATIDTDRAWMQGDNITASPLPSPSKSPIPFALSCRDEPKRELPVPSSAAFTSTIAAAAAAPLTAVRRTMALPAKNNGSNSSDPLSTIPPQHLHTMRESFSVLDRNNAGVITPADVATALAELGLDNSPATLAAYFPATSSSLNLGAYLGMLTQDLTRLSRQDELAAAFAAFDDDDSGQIDVAELRDALLGIATEQGKMMDERDIDGALDGFVGRRVLQRGQTGAGLGGGKKEVFRYRDFTTGIWGGTTVEQQGVKT